MELKVSVPGGARPGDSGSGSFLGFLTSGMGSVSSVVGDKGRFKLRDRSRGWLCAGEITVAEYRGGREGRR